VVGEDRICVPDVDSLWDVTARDTRRISFFDLKASSFALESLSLSVKLSNQALKSVQIKGQKKYTVPTPFLSSYLRAATLNRREPFTN
jgi:hypothetical protein